MEKEKAKNKITALLEHTVKKNKQLRSGVLLVHSDRLDIHWELATGTTGKQFEPVTAEHPYHVASIGKLMTSVLVAKLVEDDKLSYDDIISKFLPSSILNGLHVFKGRSYLDEIKIRHLLNHTSGIPDYFDEKPKEGKPVLELAIIEPDRFWTPQETIAWANDNLHAHFPPGKGFFYSDTGYQLLGLIIEKITGAPMHLSLHDMIFTPLGMEHTYQLFYSEPAGENAYPLIDTYLGETEVSKFRSVSIDWAGGGVVSTPGDLLRFIRALNKNTLIAGESFEKMKDWAPFARGIDYGYGLAHVDYHKILCLFSKRLRIWGNFGSTATFMFYNPAGDFYTIGAFNHSSFVKNQMLFLAKTIGKLLKIEPGH